MDKPYIKLSDDVYNALFSLKKFNYKNIYSKAMSDEEISYYRKGMNKIYSKYINDLENCNTESIIYKIFLNDMDKSYIDNNNKRKVIDFIAGMTDDLFISEIEENN